MSAQEKKLRFDFLATIAKQPDHAICSVKDNEKSWPLL